MQHYAASCSSTNSSSSISLPLQPSQGRDNKAATEIMTTATMLHNYCQLLTDLLATQHQMPDNICLIMIMALRYAPELSHFPAKINVRSMQYAVAAEIVILFQSRHDLAEHKVQDESRPDCPHAEFSLKQLLIECNE